MDGATIRKVKVQRVSLSREGGKEKVKSESLHIEGWKEKVQRRGYLATERRKFKEKVYVDEG